MQRGMSAPPPRDHPQAVGTSELRDQLVLVRGPVAVESVAAKQEATVNRRPSRGRDQKRHSIHQDPVSDSLAALVNDDAIKRYSGELNLKKVGTPPARSQSPGVLEANRTTSGTRDTSSLPAMKTMQSLHKAQAYLGSSNSRITDMQDRSDTANFAFGDSAGSDHLLNPLIHKMRQLEIRASLQTRATLSLEKEKVSLVKECHAKGKQLEKLQSQVQLLQERNTLLESEVHRKEEMIHRQRTSLNQLCARYSGLQHLLASEGSQTHTKTNGTAPSQASQTAGGSSDRLCRSLLSAAIREKEELEQQLQSLQRDIEDERRREKHRTLARGAFPLTHGNNPGAPMGPSVLADSANTGPGDGHLSFSALVDLYSDDVTKRLSLSTNSEFQGIDELCKVIWNSVKPDNKLLLSTALFTGMKKIIETGSLLLKATTLARWASILKAAVGECIKCREVLILMVDVEKGVLSTFINEEHLGQEPEEVSQHPIEVGLAGYAVTTKSLFKTPQAEAEPRFQRTVDGGKQEQVGALMNAPVLDSEGKVMAVIQVLNSVDEGSSMDFNQVDELALLLLAKTAVGSLHNILNLTAIRNLHKMFQALAEGPFKASQQLAIGVSKPPELDDVVDSLERDWCSLTGARRVRIFVVDHKRVWYLAEDLDHEIRTVKRRFYVDGGVGLCATMFAMRQTLYIEDVPCCQLYNDLVDLPIETKHPTLICIPVLDAAGSVISIIQSQVPHVIDKLSHGLTRAQSTQKENIQSSSISQLNDSDVRKTFYELAAAHIAQILASFGHIGKAHRASLDARALEGAYALAAAKIGSKAETPLGGEVVKGARKKRSMADNSRVHQKGSDAQGKPDAVNEPSRGASLAEGRSSLTATSPGLKSNYQEENKERIELTPPKSPLLAFPDAHSLTLPPVQVSSLEAASGANPAASDIQALTIAQPDGTHAALEPARIDSASANPALSSKGLGSPESGIGKPRPVILAQSAGNTAATDVQRTARRPSSPTIQAPKEEVVTPRRQSIQTVSSSLKSPRFLDVHPSASETVFPTKSPEPATSELESNSAI